MKKTALIVFIGLFALSFSLVSDSLNLVEIQKKEKKRREKLKKSKYILNNDKIIEFSLKKSKTFVESDVTVTTASKSITNTKKKEEEKKDEVYWRGRLKTINDGMEQTKAMIQETQSALNKASSDFLIATTPSLQQELRAKINNMQKQLAELGARLEQKEGARELFFREARRSGALPGLLR